MQCQQRFDVLVRGATACEPDPDGQLLPGKNEAGRPPRLAQGLLNENPR